MPRSETARPEAARPVTAEIDVGVGHVDLVATDRDDVVAEVSPTRPRRAGDESLAREASVVRDGGDVRIHVPRRLNLFGQSDSVDVRVELPTGSRIVVDSTYGSIQARGEFGTGRITAKYGDVVIDSVGDLRLNSPYGTIEIADVRGRLDATLGHGQLRVDRVAGEARLRGSHGTIDLGTVHGALEVWTVGAVTVDRALGDVTARSVHGAIRLREVAGGTVRIENGYAAVEVGVPADVAAWVDAASAHGTVRNELTPDPEAAGRDRTVELRLRADWGDVTIRRSLSRGRPGGDHHDR